MKRLLSTIKTMSGSIALAALLMTATAHAENQGKIQSDNVAALKPGEKVYLPTGGQTFTADQIVRIEDRADASRYKLGRVVMMVGDDKAIFRVIEAPVE